MGATTDSLLDAFLFETNSLLEQLDTIVLEAEQKDNFSQDDINTIFRIMHTIKGSSAMMEYHSLMSIAHRVEDLFAIIRETSIDIVAESKRPQLFDLLFQSIDFFRSELEKLENSKPLTDDIGQLLEKINTFIAQIQQKGEAEEESPSAEQTELPQAPANYPYTLQLFFDEGCGMENLRAFMLLKEIRDVCAEDTFVFQPEDVEHNPGCAAQIIEKGFVLHFKEQADRERVLPVVTGSGFVRTYQMMDQPSSPAPEVTEKPAAEEAAAPVPSKAQTAPAAAPEANTPHHRESLISVSLSKLDELAAVVGEIVITESMVTSSPDLKGIKLDSFLKSARQLRKLTDELQDVSMSLRMIPVSGTFQKMNRIVRDMSRKLGKQAKLVLVGEDTEIDKTIVDSIADPIMHIVRNSMDHGIEECVEDRIAAGKDPVGQIVLSARHTGSEVIIEVADDGQGINYEAVRNKAIRSGLASPDVEYSNRDIINFLMAPGFSTNTEVTEYSGRGVGMDVVKKNVEEVGGTVSITSEPGKGMTTTIKIPLTMAIMNGMEVAVGNYIFTIPIHNIRQSFRISQQDIIHDASGGELFKCMGCYYPVVRMRDLYSLEEGAVDVEDGILIWLESGELSYCLFVDQLLGEQQVVVKPLPSYLNAFHIKHRGIAGCTILGDGNISIILDVATLFTPVS